MSSSATDEVGTSTTADMTEDSTLSVSISIPENRVQNRNDIQKHLTHALEECVKIHTPKAPHSHGDTELVDERDVSSRGNVTSLACLRGTVLASCDDGIVNLWRRTDFLRSKRIEFKSTSPVNSATFGRNTDTIFAGSHDGVGRVWDVNTNTTVALSACGGPINTCKWSDVMNVYITSCDDGSVSTWDPRTSGRTPSATMRVPRASVAMDRSEYNHVVAVAMDNASVAIVDFRLAHYVAVYSRQGRTVPISIFPTSIVLMPPTAKYAYPVIAMGTECGRVAVIHAIAPSVEEAPAGYSFKSLAARVNSVAVSSVGNVHRLVTAGSAACRKWDTDARTCKSLDTFHVAPPMNEMSAMCVDNALNCIVYASTSPSCVGGVFTHCE